MRFQRCPKSFLLFQAVKEARWVADWSWLEKHKVMPRDGGLLDQCPKWVEAIELVTHEVQKLERSQKDDSQNVHRSARQSFQRHKKGF